MIFDKIMNIQKKTDWFPPILLQGFEDLVINFVQYAINSKINAQIAQNFEFFFLQKNVTSSSLDEFFSQVTK
jgi:hypothetical protein